LAAHIARITEGTGHSLHCGCQSLPLYVFRTSPRGQFLSLALQVHTN